MGIVLTKSSWPIIKWICDILGWLMDGIYIVLDKIGIPNIGLAIVLFTLIIYLLMTPLQIKQQKFSKLNSVMTPELQKIQKKYKDKRDQASMIKMQEETSAVYQKYGVSPTGSCLQMLIQMPILVALYQVIYRIPAYVSSIRSMFEGTVEKVMAFQGYGDKITEFIKANSVRMTTGSFNEGKNGVIDFLYSLNGKQWDAFTTEFGINVDEVRSSLNGVRNFLGLNIAESPWSIMQEQFGSLQNEFTVAALLILIGAIMIPLLAWFTQWLNFKLMPQAAPQQNQDPKMDSVQASMKTMNSIMPLMSAFFCMTFAVGIGIYWIAGAVIRSLQQLIINREMDKVDINSLIAKNQEKINKKRAKQGLPPQKITQQARINVRNIENEPEKEKKNYAEERSKATEYYNSTTTAKPGSIAAKANMVKQYDDKKKK